jgi:hypothetical protein
MLVQGDQKKRNPKSPKTHVVVDLHATMYLWLWIGVNTVVIWTKIR